MIYKAKYRAEMRALADGQQAVTRCSCGWYFKGLIRDGKRAFKAHRERCGRLAA